MVRDRLYYLFEAYIQNKATPEEVEELMVAVKNGEADLMLASFVLAHKKNVGHPTSRTDAGATRKKPDAPSFRKGLRVAAVLLGILVAVSLWLFYRNSSKLESARQQSLVYSSGDFVRNVLLPDSSVVVLQKYSKLFVDSGFGNKDRLVELEGEAYFDVVHDAKKPFLITAGSLNIKVVGTAFDVKAYAEKDSVEVYVDRGKVEVFNKERSSRRLLLPNNYAKLDKKSQTLTSDEFRFDSIRVAVVSWKDSDLVFNGDSMRKVLSVLEKRYNVVFDVQNPSLYDCRVQISFAGTEKLEQVLSSLSLIQHIDYTAKGDSITINGLGCQ